MFSQGMDVFALKADTQMRLIAIIAGTRVATTIGSLVLGEWTFVTATFQTYGMNSELSGIASIYFWTTQQTTENWAYLTNLNNAYGSTLR